MAEPAPLDRAPLARLREQLVDVALGAAMRGLAAELTEAQMLALAYTVRRGLEGTLRSLVLDPTTPDAVFLAHARRAGAWARLSACGAAARSAGRRRQ